MIERGVYLWIVAKKNIDPLADKNIYDSYKSVKCSFHFKFSIKRLLKTTDL